MASPEYQQPVLDLLGLTLPTQPVAIEHHGYRFEDICRPDDTLVREHFADFAATAGTVRCGNYTRAFHVMLDQNGEDAPFLSSIFQKDPIYPHQTLPRVQMREPKPMEGIRVLRRSMVGLPPYEARNPLISDKEKILALYGIEAGSMVEAVPRQLERMNPNTQLAKALGQLTARLALQLG